VIRAVVTDFGGVLTVPLDQAFAGAQERTGVSSGDLRGAMFRATETHGGSPPLWELERGEISEEEFLRRLSAELPGEATLRGFGAAYFEHLHSNEPMISFMGALHARGLRAAILTNNVREWDELWRAKVPDLEAVFETVVDSAWVGIRKPDRAIYELTLERLGDVAPEECVFVDDLEINCTAAAEIGMRPVHFRDNDQAMGEIEAALTG
jgi:putative hydrolase of the HAD superfamily